MPLYTWIEPDTGQTVNVIRSVADRHVPPTIEELFQVFGTRKPQDLERQVGVGIRTIRGANWNGSKGNW